jgi:hypothetical protein
LTAAHNVKSNRTFNIQPFLFNFLNPNWSVLNAFSFVSEIMLRQTRATLLILPLFSLIISLYHYYSSGDVIRRSLWSLWQQSSNMTAFGPIAVQCYDTPPSGSASAQVLNGPPTTRFRGSTYFSSVRKRVIII